MVKKLVQILYKMIRAQSTVVIMRQQKKLTALKPRKITQRPVIRLTNQNGKLNLVSFAKQRPC